MKFIVTAGGQGKKLWPYSTYSRPKQFQHLVDGHSPYEMAVNTLLQGYSSEDIFISTKKSYVGLALQQAPRIGIRNLIVEPDIQKDRGPAEGLAFLKLDMEYPDEPFMIIQADNIRTPDDEFLKTIQAAEDVVRRDKKFISGGIKASYPVLGVDYIKLGAQVPQDSGVEIYKGDSFLGRNNDFYKTKELIQNYHVTIHCNHNCWYPSLMLDAYKQYRPDWYEGLMKIKEVIGKADEDLKIAEIYSEMEAGATEQVTKHLWTDSYIILLPFKWTDIGTWNSLYEFLAPNDDVYSDGQVIALSTKNSLIKSSNPKKLTAIYGLDNMVVVDTEDILLVMPKDKTEKVSELLEEIKLKGLESYL